MVNTNASTPQQLINQLDKTKPCIEWYNNSCNCFDADDHYKGGKIYYSPKYCSLRNQGTVMPTYDEELNG